MKIGDVKVGESYAASAYVRRGGLPRLEEIRRVKVVQFVEGWKARSRGSTPPRAVEVEFLEDPTAGIWAASWFTAKKGDRLVIRARQILGPLTGEFGEKLDAQVARADETARFKADVRARLEALGFTSSDERRWDEPEPTDVDVSAGSTPSLTFQSRESLLRLLELAERSAGQ